MTAAGGASGAYQACRLWYLRGRTTCRFVIRRLVGILFAGPALMVFWSLTLPSVWVNDIPLGELAGRKSYVR